MNWIEKLLGGQADSDQKRAESLNRKAIDALSRNQIDRAEEMLVQAVKLAPDMAAAHHNLGAIRLKQKRYSQALKHMRRAVRLDGKDVESQIAVARIYDEMGKQREAIEEYRRISAEFPEDWRSHVSLGNALLARDQNDEATEPLERATQLAPKEELAHLVLATAYERRGDRDRAIAEYRLVRKTSKIKQNRSAADRKIQELSAGQTRDDDTDSGDQPPQSTPPVG